ncbi:lytic polysaccharide monooxygenase [Lentithecium fluviatile CBS 122367]|uniref:AA9 family lytic polysaccharide monooxygenase n=1 Tax=Lentithecium fluviatile CBS 122367 TaxID=1168545 RepID=A0A6G1IMX6_9PLEO|nr:lytic polysaccharide monooxygenase [Lentithecium fluviatile CBS 122367]
MRRSKAPALLLTTVPISAAHGGGMYYTIDGVLHAGAYPWVSNTTTGSIQRTWTWDGLTTPTSPHMPCNTPGTPFTPSYHASLTAGTTISISYAVRDSKATFGHPYGPMLAYMAACPASGCEAVNLSAPIWFKIWEAGLLSGGFVDGRWAMRDVFEGAEVEIKVPRALRKGKYLLRHEMVNLQTGAAQFFPNCVQVEVRGTGDTMPKTEELVKFPGAYDGDWGTSWPPETGDPYNTWFYVDHQDDTHYPMPGPPVWQG